MPKVIVSPLAQADIEEIRDHIARDSILNADRFVDRIERRFALLADNPGLGVAREDLRPGLRRFAHAALSDLLSTDPGRNRSGPCGPWGTQARAALQMMTGHAQ
jgi:plasmid stabilization system protein ParE